MTKVFAYFNKSAHIVQEVYKFRIRELEQKTIINNFCNFLLDQSPDELAIVQKLKLKIFVVLQNVSVI